MAARLGLQLDAGHVQRVVDGEITLAGLAAELGVARQTLHVAFRRRGWPTTVQDQAAKAGIVPGTPRRPIERRQAPKAQSHRSESNRSPAPALAPPAAILWPAAEDTAEIARHELANIGLLALAQLRDALSAGQRLGPAALKAAAQAAQLLADVLDRAGVPISQAELPAPFGLVFEEMSEAECQATQADAEAGYAGAFVTDDAI